MAFDTPTSTPDTVSPDLPKEMKAQLLTSFNTPYQLTTVPLPTLSSPNDLLIRVTAASYCHTDAVLAAGSMLPFPPSFPHVGCHEFAGVVVAVAPTHATSSPSPLYNLYKPGDRVGVPGRAYNPCGTCFECSAGEDEDADPPGYSVYCPHALNHGISAPGGFREYAVVDARQVARIPEGGSGLGDVDTSVLMCAGVTIYAALKRCVVAGQGQGARGLGVGELRVGIMGCGGGLGHLGLQFAMAMGFKGVVGVDVADGPLRVAREAVEEFRARGGGVDGGKEGGGKYRKVRIVDARVEEADAVAVEIGKCEDGKTDREDMGLDAVIILPESQKAFDYGVRLLRRHGRCVVVSFPEKGFQISASDVVFRDITIMGSLVGSNKILREMLQFAADHGVRAKIKTFPLEKLNDLVEEYYKAEGGKLVIDMSLSS